MFNSLIVNIIHVFGHMETIKLSYLLT